MRPPLKSTFSIVAVGDSGEVGCAVQSKYFAVGAVVPWARAGVGAVATQAAGVAVYGSRALDELAGGATPQEALERVLAGDPERETRQLGIVAADGRAAAFTGADCLDWAGHLVRDGFSVQGNILASGAVVEEMAHAFADAKGSLAERLVTALEAGQEAGGDRRGQQSAAVVVERTGASRETREGVDRICDLRVEDAERPIAELRRLVGIWVGWEVLRRSGMVAEREGPAAAADLLAGAAERGGDEALLLYNLACYESLAGRSDAAVRHLRRAVDLDPSYRALAVEDPDFDPIRTSLSEL